MVRRLTLIVALLLWSPILLADEPQAEETKPEAPAAEAAPAEPARAEAAQPEVAQPPAPRQQAPARRRRPAQSEETKTLAEAFQPEWIKALAWRPIGPASMGGRIVDLEVVESDPFTFYIATASGGLFKTTNNGTTFTPIFEREKTVSIGDLAVSPSDPNVLWLGTGEHNARNSVSWGDGVYRSTDGGRTWKNVGLEKSFQIGRIAVHPTNPDIAYVGALGRLWGPNEERGLYKTTDGGQTWERVLYVDDKTGCIEVQMHPRDPETLLVAMYERERDRYSGGDPAKRWGPGSGIHKTTDGGRTWRKITQGLPNRPLGRIGIDYFRSDPNIVFAIVESDKIGSGPASAYMGISGEREDQGGAIRGVTAGGPAEKAGMQAGDKVIELGGQPIDSYNDLVVAIRRYKPGETTKLKVQRGEETKDLEVTWGERPSTASALPFTSYLGGQRANAMAEQGEGGNETGGVYRSSDGGESWTRINSLNPRPFYYSQIRVDPSDDRYVYVLGVQFHYSTDGGREFRTGASRVHADHHDLWINPRDGRHLILGCDGGLYMSHDRGRAWDFHDIMDIGQFYDVGVDTRHPYWVYGGLQDNGSWGGISRKRGGAGPANPDWVRIGGGDGFVCRVDPNNPDLVYYESQYGRMARLNVRTGARERIAPPAEEGLRFRFNWKTPFTLSHHNSSIFYCAGNYVWRSLDRGNDLRRISDEITGSSRGSATALAESPLDPDVLYVGTDDGLLWVTKNGGASWDNITDNVKLPGSFHVSTIETSRFAAGRAYVAFDGHRSDNDDPHLYATEDFGQTWKSLNANLPTGSTHCLREDVVNPDLLYCGTEFAVWVSVNRGQEWLSLNNNLPTVAVHEIAVHPTQSEIVAATHGRSLWILDVAPLRQLAQPWAADKTHLFRPAGGVLWAGTLSHNMSGHRHFTGQNPGFGSSLYYFLAEEAKEVRLEIADIEGNVVRRLRPNARSGLHRLVWDLRRSPPERNQPAAGGSGPQRGQAAQTLGPPVDTGTYLVRLSVDGTTITQPVRVDADPEFPAAMLLEELEEHEAKSRPEFTE